ncbi:MAG: tol-pal system protein YbgF [Steroidobacterales bacterium]
MAIMSSLLRQPLCLAIATLALAGCESTPAQPDPTVVKLNDVDERLGRVEHVNQGLLQLSQRLDAIEAQMRQLRGELEEVQNSNDMLRKQQRDLYADLDRRLSALQAGSKSAAGPGDTSGGGGGADSGGEQAAYTRAFDALKTTDYAGAITRFRDFLRGYPQSQLAGNAQYWLGEAYYVTHDYDNAAASFRAVGEQYPQSPKVPDALLKLGLTQIDQKKLTEARATLKQVGQRFPNSDAAKLAAARLQNIPADEH